MVSGLPVKYLLKFLDSQEQVVREIDVEADEEEDAIIYSCQRSVRSGMAIELREGNMTVIRVTPMTARLYLPDRPR